MVLFVDSREDKADMFIEHFTLAGIKAEKKSLLVGDFMLGGRGLVIERKTVSDFIQSIFAGHLQKQLLNMRQYPHRVVIVVGDTMYMDWDGYWGAVASIMVRYDVKIFRVDDDEECCRLVEKLVVKAEELGNGRAAPTIYNTEVFRVNHNDVNMRVLMAFEGIGPKRARALLGSEDIRQQIEELRKRVKKK